MDHAHVSQAQGIHSSIALTYANAAARTGATGFASTDIGKLALQSDNQSYWILVDTTPTWSALTVGGVEYKVLSLVSGNQSAGSTYTLIGAVPSINYSQLDSTLELTTLVQIPSGSTARVRLYDVTHSAVLYESSIVSGPQTDRNLGTVGLTAPVGTSVIELWMATPTNTGGNATCLSAALLATKTFGGGGAPVGGFTTYLYDGTSFSSTGLRLPPGGKDSSGISQLFEGNGTTADVTLGSDPSAAVMAQTLTGLSANRLYHCTLSFQVTLVRSSNHAQTCSMDCTVDLNIATNGSSVATVTVQSNVVPDISRVRSELTGATMTIAPSTGGFTIYATRPPSLACLASARWMALEIKDVT